MKNINIAQSAEEYDAIVVGSGVSGGWAAKELCEKGLKTLVLDRGRPIEHVTDYVTEHKAPWHTITDQLPQFDKVELYRHRFAHK